MKSYELTLENANREGKKWQKVILRNVAMSHEDFIEKLDEKFIKNLTFTSTEQVKKEFEENGFKLSGVELSKFEVYEQ